MSKFIKILTVALFAIVFLSISPDAWAQTAPTGPGGVPISTGNPSACSCPVDNQSIPCGVVTNITVITNPACPVNSGGVETVTTTTPYICNGNGNTPTEDGPQTVTVSTTSCLPLTAVPTYGACSTTCGTGTEPVVSYYCVDSSGTQYPASDCTAPSAQSCTATAGCCPANPPDGMYSGLEPNCVLTCDAGYTVYNGTCVLDCPVNTTSTSYGPEPTCTPTCNAGYVSYNGTCVPACPADTVSTSYSEPTCAPVCNTGYVSYNGTCVPACPVNTVSTSYSEPTCAPVCNAGYVSYNGTCVPACPADTASTSYSEPTCAPVCNTGYVSYNGTCVPGCPANTVSTSYSEPTCAPVCNTGYVSYNGTCVPACPVNTVSTSYSEPTCAPVCNTGYTLENGSCVANCPADPANGMYGAPPQCTLTCNSGYMVSNGQCVVNPCPANPANGMYGAAPQCTLTCDVGYTASNGQCVPNPCPANPANGMYGAAPQCTLTCDAGYSLSNGQCVPNPCPANPANGSYGTAPQCTLTCDVGYTVSNGQCVANPCPANPANGSYGAAPQCPLTCNAGYTVSNGQCVANAVNGACGSACGVEDPNNPGTDGSQLCSAGNATSVTLSGNTWMWTCQGANGGSDAPGSAPQYYQGTCAQGGLGGSGTIDYDSAGWVSTSGCCYEVGASNQSYNLNGAATPGCNGPVNGQCGSDNGGTFSNYPWLVNPAGLCANDPTGTTAANGAVNGNTYSYTCAGSYGGNAATCTATYAAPVSQATEVCGGNGTSCAYLCNGNGCEGGYMEPNDNLGDGAVASFYDDHAITVGNECPQDPQCFYEECNVEVDTGALPGECNSATAARAPTSADQQIDKSSNISMYPENAQAICLRAGYQYLVYWTFDVDLGLNNVNYATDYNPSTNTWGKVTSDVYGAGFVTSVWCGNSPPPNGAPIGAVAHPDMSQEGARVTLYLPSTPPTICPASGTTPCSEAPASAGPVGASTAPAYPSTTADNDPSLSAYASAASSYAVPAPPPTAAAAPVVIGAPAGTTPPASGTDSGTTKCKGCNDTMPPCKGCSIQ